MGQMFRCESILGTKKEQQAEAVFVLPLEPNLEIDSIQQIQKMSVTFWCYSAVVQKNEPGSAFCSFIKPC